jgi:kynurenine formamidase
VSDSLPQQVRAAEFREAEVRAHFDARVTFANGGGLTAEGFRIDLPHPDVDAGEVGRLFVQHLGLALVGSVEVTNLVVVEEQHRGTRGIETVPTASGRRVVDLSHVIREGVVTLPGIPAPVISSHLTREDSRRNYAAGTEFTLDVITLPGNTGTYLDSPWHRYAEGADLSGLELASLIDVPTEVFHLTDLATRGIPAEVFWDRDVRGKAVLLHTGWDRHFGTPDYAAGAPFLSPAGVEYLAAQGVLLVGIDSINIDDMVPGGERPAHTVLLGAGIHIVEHLTNLGELPPSGARFTAVPPAVEGFGTFPVRSFATVD